MRVSRWYRLFQWAMALQESFLACGPSKNLRRSATMDTRSTPDAVLRAEEESPEVRADGTCRSDSPKPAVVPRVAGNGPADLDGVIEAFGFVTPAVFAEVGSACLAGSSIHRVGWGRLFPALRVSYFETRRARPLPRPPLVWVLDSRSSSSPRPVRPAVYVRGRAAAMLAELS